MALLNYTTEITVDRTLGEITAMLAGAGANSIKSDYEGGQPTKISFLLKTPYGIQAFVLPANINAVFEVMNKQYHQGKIPGKFISQAQAARVGWRIVKDWIAAQLAIVETDMVTFHQVMFPYMIDSNDRSIYELYTEQRLALPSGAKK